MTILRLIGDSAVSWERFLESRLIGFGQKQSLDDDEAGAGADVPFNPRQLVAWRNESPQWIGSNALVSLTLQTQAS